MAARQRIDFWKKKLYNQLRFMWSQTINHNGQVVKYLNKSYNKIKVKF